MSELAWMFVAFAAVGIGLGTYLVSLAARRRRVERRRKALTETSPSERPH